MKLYDAFAARGYHTSITTSFGIDFDTYEHVALPRLRGSGCTNNLLISDHRMLALSLESTHALPRLAGVSYSAVGATPRAAGVYHPKLLLQLGRTQARLIVGSGNMTASGLAGNLEVASEVICDENDSPEQDAIVAAWCFVLSHVDVRQPSIERQISWALDRAPWLGKALGRPIPAGVATPWLLHSGDAHAKGIAARFAEAVGPDRVTRLVVISPYWDSKLQALDYLVARLQPESTIVFIRRGERSFPGHAAGRIKGVQVIDLDHGGLKQAQGRFVHAKILIAQTSQADHVLAGSANCTVAALGEWSCSGFNEEASLYQRLAAGSVLQALGLEDAMAAPPLSSCELAACDCVMASDIPLDAVQQRDPGRFELDQTTLQWWQPRGQDAVGGSRPALRLFDVDGQLLDVTITALPGHAAPWRFRLGAAPRPPRFAAISRSDGSWSGLAIVTWADQLRLAAREARAGQVERVLQALQGDGDEGLWLLDFIDTLEAAERAEQAGAAPGGSIVTASAPGKRSHASGQGATVPGEPVPYEQFIAKRRAHADEFNVARSTLGSSDLGAARAFLNRLLKVEQELSWQGDEADDASEDAIAGLLADKGRVDRGDEAMPLTDADVPGARPGQRAGTSPELRPGSQERRARAVDSPQDYVRAVNKFLDLCLTAAEHGGLGASHALRLRILMMVIAGAGTCRGELALRTSGRSGLQQHQVLSSNGEQDGWRRLAAIVLHTFFGQSRPLALAFRLDSGLEQVPDDFLETWATCFWVALARILARVDEKPGVPDAKALSFIERMYRLTALRPDEFSSEVVTSMFCRLNDRYALQLGVDGTEIMQLHARLSAG